MVVAGKRIPAKLSCDASQCLNLKIGNEKISDVMCHKLLGVTLDSEMSYESYVEELSKKIAKRLGLLKYISPYLKQSQREMYYTSVVKPNIMYGSMVWDNCSRDCTLRILKLQKRATRIILGMDKKTPSINLFNTLNWLPFYKESTIKRNILVFKRINSKYYVPEYLRSSLVRNCDLHNRVTRYSSLNLVCAKYKRETEGGRTFVVRTAKEWNALDIPLHSQNSVAKFKRELYAQLLQEQKSTMQL